ncbi:MAG: hypothetical protein RLY86_3756 [Pseudomonadota bacterium]|jgi:orotate phosphoribosyltransferase
MLPDFADMELRQGAIATARLLLETGCVRYDADAPFRLAQGYESPLHVDARLALGHVHARDALLRLALEMIARDIDREDVHRDDLDMVACRTEGQGVPFATLIADRLNLPLVFVRRDGGEDPHKSRVEGHIPPGSRILLVEQMASDGARKVALVQALTEAGGVVRDLFVLFQYGIFDEIHTRLSPLGVRLHALASWWDILEAAADGRHLPPAALADIRRFLDHPAHWSPGRA